MNLKKWISTGTFLLATTAFQTAMAGEDVDVVSDPTAEIQATRTVNIPADDYFLPMIVSVRVGDSVRFTNNDTDPHTVTSDPVYSSGGFQNVNVTLKPKTATAGPGAVTFRFNRSGIFTYYCRNHAHLVQGQPVNGGIVGNGVAGRPMMGVIVVR